MDYFERMALIEGNETQIAELKRDIAERKGHTARGEDPVMWQSSEPQRPQQDVIYKTYQPQPTQQQQAAAMDEKTADAWNSWLTTYVTRALEANNEAAVDSLGEAFSLFRAAERKFTLMRIAKAQVRLRKEFNQALASLRTEFARESTDKVLPLRKPDVA